MPYVYVLVRRDISLADQMVQAAHASQESGAQFGCPDSCHMVLCGVKDESELRAAALHIELNNIQLAMFYEPDSDQFTGKPMGYTALCTEPIHGEQRKAMRKFQTWKEDVGN